MSLNCNQKKPPFCLNSVSGSRLFAKKINNFFYSYNRESVRAIISTLLRVPFVMVRICVKWTTPKLHYWHNPGPNLNNGKSLLINARSCLSPASTLFHTQWSAKHHLLWCSHLCVMTKPGLQRTTFCISWEEWPSWTLFVTMKWNWLPRL